MDGAHETQVAFFSNSPRSLVVDARRDKRGRKAGGRARVASTKAEKKSTRTRTRNWTTRATPEPACEGHDPNETPLSWSDRWDVKAKDWKVRRSGFHAFLLLGNGKKQQVAAR